MRRIRRTLRYVRAIWHDTVALWREFNKPIIGFVLMTVVGGFIYGELYYIARGQYIDLIDRPYLMLQLMVIEPPEDAPPEWYLIIFWYLLPPYLVFLIGLGAADFVRLFFFRNERRNAWQEAVALTYRNHIIVFGAGHVGLRVIRELVSMGFDLVAVDDDPDAGVPDLLRTLDVPLIVADGRMSSTLEKAGLRYAEAFVACVGNDHVNLEAIMRARDMNPDVRIVARMWDDQFAKQIRQFMNVQSVLSSSDLSAPAFAGAAVGIEITQTLHIQDVEYSMIRLIVEAGSFLDGRDVGTLQKENDMDIVLHSRDDVVDVQPSRGIRVEAGDTLVIFARHDRILEVVNRNRRRATRQM
jgi:Trk K+ transport system NAD-binding subunit